MVQYTIIHAEEGDLQQREWGEEVGGERRGRKRRGKSGTIRKKREKRKEKKQNKLAIRSEYKISKGWKNLSHGGKHVCFSHLRHRLV